MWAKLGATLGSSMEQACAQSYLVSPHGTSCPVKLQRHGVAEGRLNSGVGGTAGIIYYLCLRHLMTPIFRHRNSWIQFGIVFHTLNSDSSLHVLELSSTSSFKRESCLFKHKRASKDQCLAMVNPEKSYWFHQHLHCFLRAHWGRSWSRGYWWWTSGVSELEKKKLLWTAEGYIKIHERLQKVFALDVLDTQL